MLLLALAYPEGSGPGRGKKDPAALYLKDGKNPESGDFKLTYQRLAVQSRVGRRFLRSAIDQWIAGWQLAALFGRRERSASGVILISALAV